MGKLVNGYFTCQHRVYRVNILINYDRVELNTGVIIIYDKKFKKKKTEELKL